MVTKYKIFYLKILYIFFVFLSLNIFFFSTTKVYGKAFNINNVEISEPFQINFDKNEILDEGFKKAFQELISLIVNSIDKKKINNIKLNEIKGMIESFSIKEEKFVKEIYYVNLGVSFNKKKIFEFLENKNIFPSIPNEKKFFFIPIVIDEKKKDLLIFSQNMIFKEWNNYNKKNHLIEYILPTEDLEDLRLIKKNYENIEKYDFKEISNKYYLNDSIIALIFKNEQQLRILSRITYKDNIVLINQSFVDLDLNNKNQVPVIIRELKTIYEDFWKKSNQINTSIKLSLSVKIETSDNLKISNFENVLKELDLIYDFSISKFNKDFIFYEIIFNGTTDIFLKTMKENRYSFDTQNKIWILK